MKRLLILAIVLINLNLCAQELTIVNQDFDTAIELAKKNKKLLFIDFYTTWCGPCKQLDKLVFKDRSVQNKLDNNFVLLKYNAEDDKIFHLSKKHHVSSYPTGIILNWDGHTINRVYGFKGEDEASLKQSVFNFTNEAMELAKQGKYIKGYSNKIEASKYPKFYIDFINRDNIRPDKEVIKNYFKSEKDKLSESYFSTLMYFASNGVPNEVADYVINNKQKYIDLYGENDVNITLYFISSGKFKKALENKNEQEFKLAESFIKSALNEDWYKSVIHNYKLDFLKAENKWNEVFKINEGQKIKGDFSDGEVNHFSWNVYKECNDQDVILNCVKWMKELTNRNPKYAYLDTYAFLLYKSGNILEAKKVAKRALDIGRKENRNVKSLEKLLAKLK